MHILRLVVRCSQSERVLWVRSKVRSHGRVKQRRKARSGSNSVSTSGRRSKTGVLCAAAHCSLRWLAYARHRRHCRLRDAQRTGGCGGAVRGRRWPCSSIAKCHARRGQCVIYFFEPAALLPHVLVSRHHPCRPTLLDTPLCHISLT